MSLDQDLINRVKRGDENAFDDLFIKYYDRIYSFACALLKDMDAAQDVVQDVFLNLWKNRKKLDPHRSILNYLLVSTRNGICNFLKLKYNTVIEHIDFPDIEDTTPDAHTILEYYESSSFLRQIVRDMPLQRRRIFIMSRVQHMSNDEIANLLNLSRRTVERHIYLALKDVRTMWDKGQNEFPN